MRGASRSVAGQKCDGCPASCWGLGCCGQGGTEQVDQDRLRGHGAGSNGSPEAAGQRKALKSGEDRSPDFLRKREDGNRASDGIGSVHNPHGAVDEGGFVADQKQGDVGYFLRPAEAFHGLEIHEALQPSLIHL